MSHQFRRPLRRFEAGTRLFDLGRQTKIAGVLNLTPDSFSDGGLFTDPSRALEHALRLESEGADFLDIGAESTRPGARALSWREEWRRLSPILKRLSSRIRIPLSVDTYKPETAAAALEAGASIINDITGCRTKKMARVIARHRASVILMHMQGSPRTMQKNPRYENILKEVRGALSESIDLALQAGIERRRIVVDPGFGFGKTPLHNLQLLRGLERLTSLGCPVLVGLSRKSFLGYYSGVEKPAERLAASLGAAAAAVFGGAHIVRVHDVKPHREMLGIVDRMMGDCIE